MNIDSVFSLLAYCRQFGDISILGTGQIALEIIKDIPADGRICIKKIFAASNAESVPDNIWGLPCERLTEMGQIKTSCVIVAIPGADGVQAVKVLREIGVTNVAMIDDGYIRVLLARQMNTGFNDKEIRQDLDIMRRALGRIECRQQESIFVQPGGGANRNREFQVYSQWGEDGIIQHLIKNINISRKVFIEFGVENYTESNTRFLLMNDNWSGLVIDGSQANINYIKQDDFYWRYNLKAVQSFITAENINFIFAENGITGKIGLLSIDIDGNDYWVWKAIDIVEPDIVICEYNPRFGKERAVTIPYDPEFMRSRAHYSSLYGGASIKALFLLAKSKGYELVAGNLNGNNVFFVRKELLNDRVCTCDIDEAYIRNQYREARDKQGRLSYIQPEDEWELIKNMPLVVVG